MRVEGPGNRGAVAEIGGDKAGGLALVAALPGLVGLFEAREREVKCVKELCVGHHGLPEIAEFDVGEVEGGAGVELVVPAVGVEGDGANLAFGERLPRGREAADGDDEFAPAGEVDLDEGVVVVGSLMGGVLGAEVENEVGVRVDVRVEPEAKMRVGSPVVRRGGKPNGGGPALLTALGGLVVVANAVVAKSPLPVGLTGRVGNDAGLEPFVG